MHSCRAERVLRKQRQEFQFDWDAAKERAAQQKITRAHKKPKRRVIVVACGVCGACKSGMHELCKKLIDGLMKD